MNKNDNIHKQQIICILLYLHVSMRVLWYLSLLAILTTQRDQTDTLTLYFGPNTHPIDLSS